MEMHRSVYFFIILFSALFFVSCGDGGSNAQTTNLSAKTQYLSISKAPASSSVSIFQNVSLEFSAELNVSSVDSNTAYIMDSLGSVFGSEVEVDELDNSKITFIPHKYFSPDSSYTIVITTGIKDKLGRSLSENFYHLFSTQAEEVEIATLFVKSTKPSNNKIDIDPSSDFYLEFNRFVSQGNVAGNSVLELRNANGELVDGISKVFNSTISFIPTDELNTTQEYTLTLIDGVSDMFGNIYDADSNISSWNFTTTDAGFSYNKSGISRISEDDLGKSSYMIRTLKQTSTNSIVVIGTIRGIDLYKINYLIPFSKPSIEFLYSYELPSKVNALATFDDVYIIAGTKENGIYSFAAGESNLIEVSHFPSSESIYGISIGKTQGGIIDRAYAVGPKYGMGIFALYSNGVLETLTHVDQNNSIMID
ncbi:MAG: Ig-like domain-containing protein, partial [Thiovulaceae bacterium]|nr:Ig-like domain-containing protein [Sulfurimonadaceae bacterium]